MRKLLSNILIAAALGAAVPACDTPEGAIEEAQQALAIPPVEVLSETHGGTGQRRCTLFFACVQPVLRHFDFKARGRLSMIRIWSGRYIDAMELVWIDEAGQLHSSGKVGGKGGTERTFILDADEHVQAVYGWSGDYVDRLELVTNKGRTMAWGGTGGRPWKVEALPGEQIHGFAGQYYSLIDNIAVYTYKQPGPSRVPAPAQEIQPPQI
jgi:hypothetical protein